MADGRFWLDPHSNGIRFCYIEIRNMRYFFMHGLFAVDSLANFYEAVSLAFIKRNSCPVKFDFERHEAVNVSGPILRRCAMFRPPAYQYIHLFLLFSGWAPHQLSFLLEKCTLCDGIVWLHSSLYTSCPYEFFRVSSIRTFHLWDDAPRTRIQENQGRKLDRVCDGVQ